MKQIFTYIFFAISLFSTALIPSISTASITVSKLSFEAKNNTLKLKLKMSDIADYETQTLKNPPRLVIDLANTKWARQNEINSNIAGVKRIRSDQKSTGTLRIVIDLEKNTKIKDQIFILPSEKSKDHTFVVSFSTSITAKAPPKHTKKKTNNKLPTSLSNQYTNPFSKIPSFQPTKAVGYKNKTAPKRIPVIVIDAGHGGIDPGAIGKYKTKEKHITLKYAKALKNSLEKTKRYKVYLTREIDSFVNLGTRVRKARQHKGDLLISLHADSHPNPNVRGLSVYTISKKRAKREASKLAKKADKENVIAGANLENENHDIQETIIDIVQQRTKNNSASFAQMLVKDLGNDARLLENTHRSAGFVVLTGADIPSVLVELGYLSNRYEEKLLKTWQYRERLTQGITDAVNRYFKKFPPK